MATPKGTHFVVTANFLASGGPAYRRTDRSWSPRLQDAHPVATEAERDAMLAEAVLEESEVADAYAFPVRLEGSLIDPLTAREEIRASGPSVAYRRPDRTGPSPSGSPGQAEHAPHAAGAAQAERAAQAEG
ncbi:MAG TPA: DUF2849 domain-containing protein [Candidatus Limnocylindrales bacterium]|nr:DUF2849 domain-containing protein [Candidatus Limnocylindrales bacterium]